MPIPVSDLRQEIQEAWKHLEYVRAEGDQLKIDLAESSLNALLDKYRECHGCHTSQRSDDV